MKGTQHLEHVDAESRLLSGGLELRLRLLDDLLRARKEQLDLVLDLARLRSMHTREGERVLLKHSTRAGFIRIRMTPA